MNSVVEMKPQGALAQQGAGGRMAVAEIISHVATVQEVMRAVMKPEVHYGKIPGAGDKPTLLKAGAEVLCMVFRIADEYRVEDLSTPDMVRYRVTCIGRHQLSGAVLGEGMGEASSGEEKYKWRKAVCDDEFNETPQHMRRVKHARGRAGSFYKVNQVRTEPADIANTVLKMANKRAKMAMVLNVTAASDCFAQDLEDMDEALRDHLARHGEEPQEQAAPQQAAALPEFTEEHLAERLGKITQFYTSGKTADEIIAFYSLKATLSDAMKERIRRLQPKPSVTYAEVAEKINAAQSAEQLAAAEELIASVADEGQRAELIALAEQRGDQLPAF